MELNTDTVVSISDAGWAGWRRVTFTDGRIRTCSTTELTYAGIDPWRNVGPFATVEYE